MPIRIPLYAVLAATLLFTPAVFAAAFGADRPADDPRDLVRRLPARHGNALDDLYTNLLYVRTTDFGATWSPLIRAGDLSQIAPEADMLGDFSACLTSSNELCYAVYLAGATPPGVYSFTGPLFFPALVMAEGSNDFGGPYGWTDIGRTPNGDLFVIIWGESSSGNNTFWGVKSTNNGAAWDAPFVIATAPQLSPDAQYPHISDLNSPQYCFVLFQAPSSTGWDQHLLRFPAGGGPGTDYDIGQTSFSEYSYYTGNCKPIAYDPSNNALFVCFRSDNLNATTVACSFNQGLTFTCQWVTGPQRYPSIALRTATQTPFVISNVGVPSAGQYHWTWYAFDEGGYGGGLWTDRDTMVVAPLPYDGLGPLYYQNQAYFWNATHGVGSHNLWGSYTPEGLWSSRTTDGGLTWIDFTQRWHFEADSIDPISLSNCEIVGGSNGVAYIITAGHMLGTPAAYFHPVPPTTAPSYPVIVTAASWPLRPLLYPSEIGIFDDTLCVGSAHVGAYPTTITCWQRDTLAGLPGFTPGDTISFRIYNASISEERPAAAVYAEGDGTFADDLPAVVQLAAVVPPGNVGLADTLHDFGSRDVNSTTTWSAVVENTGAGPLGIFFWEITGTGFSMGPAFVDSFLLGPGADVSWSIHFTPADTMDYTGLFSITTSDPETPVVQIAVLGRGEANAPLPFHLLLPVTGDSLESEVAILSWEAASDPDSGAAPHYDVWVDTDPVMATPVLIRDSIGYTSISFVPWLSDMTYYWTVRATDNNTPGTWASDTFHFWLSGLAAGDPGSVLPRRFSLDQNYPNPFNPATTVSFAVPHGAAVRLELYDISGRRVCSLLDAWRDPGYHSVAVDGATLPNGVYFVSMTAPYFTATRKIVLLK